MQFEFETYGSEIDHLRKNSERLSEEQVAEAIKLKLEGKSLREIAKVMGISFQKVDRLIKTSASKA